MWLANVNLADLGKLIAAVAGAYVTIYSARRGFQHRSKAKKVNGLARTNEHLEQENERLRRLLNELEPRIWRTLEVEASEAKLLERNRELRLENARLKRRLREAGLSLRP